MSIIKKRIEENELLKELPDMAEMIKEDKKIDLLHKEAELGIERERLKLENANFQQDIKMRQDYAKKVFGIIKFWVISVLLLILINGILQCLFNKSLISEAVILTLIGGTTINVLGLFLIVMKYLFKYEIENKKEPIQ